MKGFREAYGKLLNSKEFKNWKKKNKNSFLSYGFLIVGDNDAWKIGFYIPEHDNISSFVVGSEIIIEPEEAIFKAPDMEVNELNIDKIKIDFNDVLKIADKRQKEKFRNDNPTKIVVILQNIDIGQVWNITYVTERMNTLNFKIDTENGDIKYEKLSSIMGMMKKGG